MGGYFGFLSAIKILILTTIGFFVMLASSGADSERIKVFGKILAISFYTIAAFSAAIVLYAGFIAK